MNPSSDRPKIENVSDTALWVAVHRALEGRRPDALFHDPLSMRLAGPRGQKIAESMPNGTILGWVMAIRTVAIDRLIQEAIRLGADTVLNLGAGLDTRPYRLDLPSNLNWIEVDFVHLIEFKTRELESEKPRCKLERISLDLSKRSERIELLKKIGERSKKAVVITEGVLPYITNTDARELAEDLASAPNIGYWIQDFIVGDLSRVMPKRVTRRMKSAPFKLNIRNWFLFFGETGWEAEQKIYIMDETIRLKRKPPFPFWARALFMLLPRKMKEAMRTKRGYCLLKRK